MLGGSGFFICVLKIKYYICTNNKKSGHPKLYPEPIEFFYLKIIKLFYIYLLLISIFALATMKIY